jgi:hypothetical protein
VSRLNKDAPELLVSADWRSGQKERLDGKGGRKGKERNRDRIKDIEEE